MCLPLQFPLPLQPGCPTVLLAASPVPPPFQSDKPNQTTRLNVMLEFIFHNLGYMFMVKIWIGCAIIITVSYQTNCVDCKRPFFRAWSFQTATLSHLFWHFFKWDSTYLFCEVCINGQLTITVQEKKTFLWNFPGSYGLTG